MGWTEYQQPLHPSVGPKQNQADIALAKTMLTMPAQVPIGVLPVGKTNSLANKLFPGHSDQVVLVLHPSYTKYILYIFLYFLLQHMSLTR